MVGSGGGVVCSEAVHSTMLMGRAEVAVEVKPGDDKGLSHGRRKVVGAVHSFRAHWHALLFSFCRGQSKLDGGAS